METQGRQIQSLAVRGLNAPTRGSSHRTPGGRAALPNFGCLYTHRLHERHHVWVPGSASDCDSGRNASLDPLPPAHRPVPRACVGNRQRPVWQRPTPGSLTCAPGKPVEDSPEGLGNTQGRMCHLQGAKGPGRPPTHTEGSSLQGPGHLCGQCLSGRTPRGPLLLCQSPGQTEPSRTRPATGRGCSFTVWGPRAQKGSWEGLWSPPPPPRESCLDGSSEVQGKPQNSLGSPEPCHCLILPSSSLTEVGPGPFLPLLS